MPDSEGSWSLFRRRSS